MKNEIVAFKFDKYNMNQISLTDLEGVPIPGSSLKAINMCAKKKL